MEYLSNPSNIRNICILAHVDHGKTTIADSLIASNGIIAHRMAGKMRYLDNRQDEQERGITMKSSSIALKFTDESNEKYLINLIDTPGHVDFCGEVSAAVRLCDGALIILDVVEGICPQTKASLELAWKEGIEPILVLNKIDRLILEHKLDETAAYLRLNQLLEQVNAIVATLITTEIFRVESSNQDDIKQDCQGDSKSDIGEKSVLGDAAISTYDWASAIDDFDDDKYYFAPTKNNVLFASAIDDWAFTISAFAKVIAARHRINLPALQKTLWGDYYIDLKQKKILKNAQARTKKNLFVSMVLENIWRIYDSVYTRRDRDKTEKICDSLDIQLKPRDLNHNDPRHQIKMIMSKWLPLSEHVLTVVARLVPSPLGLSDKRVERLLSSATRKFKDLHPETKKLKESFLKCSSGDDQAKIVYISKMIPFERDNIPGNKKRSNEGCSSSSAQSSGTETEASLQGGLGQGVESGVVFIAFARIFSGKINRGDKLYVLGPRHDPFTIESGSEIDHAKTLDNLESNEHVTVAAAEDLYLFMGRDIESIGFALAGNIIGIGGLDRHLVRTATLSNNLFCTPFNDLLLSATPILRVAIEPVNPSDVGSLTTGLKLLNQADPCVEVRLQQTGEHVIVATGEVHLQRCIKDLQDRYAKDIELNVSQPIVPFRETVVFPPKTDMVNEAIDDRNVEMFSAKRSEKTHDIEMLTPNKRSRIIMRAVPLPEKLSDYLIANTEILKYMSKLTTSRHKTDSSSGESVLDEFDTKRIEAFKRGLLENVQEYQRSKSIWRQLFQDNFIDRIWSFGPKYSGPNILVASKELDLKYSQWFRLSYGREQNKVQHIDYIDGFISGFQLATQSGPLCEEPMMNVCFIISEWTLSDQIVEMSLDRDFTKTEESSNSACEGLKGPQKDAYGPMSGQIISTVKECCRRAFQAQPQRLMSPMFSCDIQVTADALGKMYAVLGRRNGRIVHGDLREGSQTFEIKAYVPVIESLDFVNEVRKQTSGLAQPQLIFSHYELIDVDPFWTPNTEEEYALFGEKADTENQARKYMNLVRRRKGLSVQEKIVEHGEKQRTVKRNK